MNQEVKLLGCLAQFALEGIVDVTTAGTVSKTFIPNNTDIDAGGAALWVPMGIISKAAEKIDKKIIKVFRPTPGTLRIDQIKESMYERTIKFTIEECSPMMWLAMRRAFVPASPRQAGTAIGQFVPFSAATVRGWFKAQMANQDNNVQEIADQFYCHLDIPGTEYGDDKNAKFDITVTELFSTLNTSTGA